MHLSEHRLPTPRWAVQQDSFRCSEQAGGRVEELGVAEGEDDGLAQLGDDGIEPAEVCNACESAKVPCFRLQKASERRPSAPLNMTLISSACTTSPAMISSCSLKSSAVRSRPSFPSVFLLLFFASFRLDVLGSIDACGGRGVSCAARGEIGRAHV